MRVGVISDTHGLLRPEALAGLRGVEHILHAGDVGDPGILDALRAVAPLTAIRGNIDASARAGACTLLPATEAVELDGSLIYMVHALEDLDIKPEAAGVAVVVYGHSHKPKFETRSNVLYLNPGSAGPRRFRLPITLAILTLGDGDPRAELVNLMA